MRTELDRIQEAVRAVLYNLPILGDAYEDGYMGRILTGDRFYMEDAARYEMGGLAIQATTASTLPRILGALKQMQEVLAREQESYQKSHDASDSSDSDSEDESAEYSAAFAEKYRYLEEDHEQRMEYYTEFRGALNTLIAETIPRIRDATQDEREEAEEKAATPAPAPTTLLQRIAKAVGLGGGGEGGGGAQESGPSRALAAGRKAREAASRYSDGTGGSPSGAAVSREMDDKSRLPAGAEAGRGTGASAQSAPSVGSGTTPTRATRLPPAGRAH
ncbi:MAG TPA: hypothetical protein VJB02_02425 [Coxiellaceae bacterium]|nr:hypothetical protein [Coxiellaceae bacterium]